MLLHFYKCGKKYYNFHYFVKKDHRLIVEKLIQTIYTLFITRYNWNIYLKPLKKLLYYLVR